MAPLTAKSRAALSTSEFALPGSRRYPIHDEGHAQFALKMVGLHGTATEKKAVRAAVARRYPHLVKTTA